MRSGVFWKVAHLRGLCLGEWNMLYSTNSCKLVQPADRAHLPKSGAFPFLGLPTEDVESGCGEDKLPRLAAANGRPGQTTSPDQVRPRASARSSTGTSWKNRWFTGTAPSAPWMVAWNRTSWSFGGNLNSTSLEGLAVLLRFYYGFAMVYQHWSKLIRTIWYYIFAEQSSGLQTRGKQAKKQKKASSSEGRLLPESGSFGGQNDTAIQGYAVSPRNWPVALIAYAFCYAVHRPLCSPPSPVSCSSSAEAVGTCVHFFLEWWKNDTKTHPNSWMIQTMIQTMMLHESSSPSIKWCTHPPWRPRCSSVAWKPWPPRIAPGCPRPWWETPWPHWGRWKNLSTVRRLFFSSKTKDLWGLGLFFDSNHKWLKRLNVWAPCWSCCQSLWRAQAWEAGTGAWFRTKLEHIPCSYNATKCHKSICKQPGIPSGCASKPL